jgi:hypothetical protein
MAEPSARVGYQRLGEQHGGTGVNPPHTVDAFHIDLLEGPFFQQTCAVHQDIDRTVGSYGGLADLLRRAVVAQVGDHRHR